MTTGRLRCALIVTAVCAVSTSAQQPASQPPFRFERPIVTDGAGPRRLAVDVPFLVGVAPSLSAPRDLRIYDANNAEVGYLFVGDPPAEPVFKPAVLLPVASVDTRAERTSGFEADLGELLLIDRFRIDGIDPPFLKRVRLEGSGDRQRWTLLVDEGSLFDLPAEKLVQRELRFAPGSYRYLRVTFDDRQTARIARMPSASAGEVGVAASTPPLVAPLVFERRPSEPGRSRFRVRLPAVGLPIAALDLDVRADQLLRDASVFQSQLSGSQLTPMLLGQTVLRRVVRNGVTASALRIPLRQPPSDAQIDLVVDDGDNPPLDLQGVSAVFIELPWIYLEAPGGGLTARYGNTTLAAPRYDLEAVRSQVRIQTVADAHWGDAHPRSADENAAAPPLPTAGASLDSALFKYLRAIPAGNAGLVAVGLDAGVLAHSVGASGGFADLRVVDASDHQVPYIVEQASEPLSLDVAVEKMSALPAALQPARPGRTVYRVKFPVAGLPASRLVLTTSARVFERGVSLVETREPDPQRRRDSGVEPIAAERWIHADQGSPAASLMIRVRPLHGSELFVIVDEGDNTPLPMTAARLLLPAYRIRFFRERNAPLRLAYGRADLERPKYDLALLAPQVLSTPAADVALAIEAAPSPLTTTAGLVSPRLFWGALALAVIVLLGLIARLLKKPA